MERFHKWHNEFFAMLFAQFVNQVVIDKVNQCHCFQFNANGSVRRDTDIGIGQTTAGVCHSCANYLAKLGKVSKVDFDGSEMPGVMCSLLHSGTLSKWERLRSLLDSGAS
jgi:hypothetical protein